MINIYPVLTKRGSAIMLNVTSVGNALRFTKIQFGTGRIAPPEDAASLQNVLLETSAPITAHWASSGTKLMLEAVLSNDDVYAGMQPTGVYSHNITEIGIWAKVVNESTGNTVFEEELVLYGTTPANTNNYIHYVSSGVTTLYRYKFQIDFTSVTDPSQLPTVQVQVDAEVTQEQFNNLTAYAGENRTRIESLEDWRGAHSKIKGAQSYQDLFQALRYSQEGDVFVVERYPSSVFEILAEPDDRGELLEAYVKEAIQFYNTAIGDYDVLVRLVVTRRQTGSVNTINFSMYFLASSASEDVTVHPGSEIAHATGAYGDGDLIYLTGTNKFYTFYSNYESPFIREINLETLDESESSITLVNSAPQISFSYFARDGSLFALRRKTIDGTATFGRVTDVSAAGFPYLYVFGEYEEDASSSECDYLAASNPLGGNGMFVKETFYGGHQYQMTYFIPQRSFDIGDDFRGEFGNLYQFGDGIVLEDLLGYNQGGPEVINYKLSAEGYKGEQNILEATKYPLAYTENGIIMVNNDTGQIILDRVLRNGVADVYTKLYLRDSVGNLQISRPLALGCSRPGVTFSTSVGNEVILIYDKPFTINFGLLTKINGRICPLNMKF